MFDYLNKKLVIVTGKGGVGKTSVSTALALRARDKGKRVLLVEIGLPSQFARIFNRHLDCNRPHDLIPGEGQLHPLEGIPLDPHICMREYLEIKLKVKPLVKVFVDTKAFSSLMKVAPGLHDLVTSGKIYYEAIRDLEEGNSPFDLIIVDAPSTGHGVGFLTAPDNYRKLFPIGPIHDDSEKMVGVFQNPQLTTIILASLAEEMPMAETVEFQNILSNQLGMNVEGVVVNKLHQNPFQNDDNIESLRQKVLSRGMSESDSAAFLEPIEYLSHKHQKQKEIVQEYIGKLTGQVVGLPQLSNIEPFPLCQSLSEFIGEDNHIIGEFEA